MISTDSKDTDTIQSSQNDIPSKVELTICNQFPGIELVSPVYASTGAKCCLSPDQSVDTGSTTRIGFNIGPDRKWSIGILMYKLQSKIFDQSNEDESACSQLVTIWEFNSSKGFYVFLRLIEHDEGHVWDKDKLMKLAFICELVNIQNSIIEKTYLIRDNTVLIARMNEARKEAYYKLSVTISKASIKNETERPWYYDVNR
jgi:hypothetical protein